MTLSSKLARRYPLDRQHALAHAEFGEFGGTVAPIRYSQNANPDRCAIADLSSLPRIGVKGWHVWDKLGARGLVCPPSNNTARVQQDHGLCLRLGDNEALLLSNFLSPDSAAYGAAGYETCDGFYPVPRNETHAWLLLTGAAIPLVLAKVCAIDLRLHKFPNLQIAQTSTAGVGTVITRADMERRPAFHLLADVTSVAYLWKELLHAAQEYEGAPIAIPTIRQLDSSHSE